MPLSLSLILETRASHELAHNRRGRYLCVTDRDEISDKLQQTVCIGVFRTILWH